MRPHPWLRRTLASRLDRSVASGLLLTVALGAAIAGGLVLGLLAYLIRSLPATQRLDNAAAAWGFDHRSELSTRGLHLVTDLGTAQVVIALALVVLAFDFVRTRGRWCAPFLLAVMIGAGAPDPLRQGSRRPRAAGVRPRGRRARPVVPERPLLDLGGLLRGRCARPDPLRPAARPHRRDRHRRLDRRRRRGKPRPARLPLALRRRRRPRPRLGLVRALRRGLRRPPPPPDRRGRGRRVHRHEGPADGAGRSSRSERDAAVSRPSTSATDAPVTRFAQAGSWAPGVPSSTMDGSTARSSAPSREERAFSSSSRDNHRRSHALASNVDPAASADPAQHER